MKCRILPASLDASHAAKGNSMLFLDVRADGYTICSARADRCNRRLQDGLAIPYWW
ncbi:hypothetical protein EVA_06087 [gut metagenome]|uniref:Uncharacterized protein n=1 Tax=gut metagenome TaxID=749906 RepID=J9GFT9_9ZZZZ